MRSIRILLIAFSLLASCVFPSCSQESDGFSNGYGEFQGDAGQTEREKIIEDFKTRHSAVELEYENSRFSAEKVDNYKGKNILTEISHIDDIFYSEDGMLMSVGSWLRDDNYLLNVTQEQYSKIKSLNYNNINYDIYIIFTLDNIEPLIPTLNAEFYFDLSTPDDVLAAEDASVSFDSHVIQGTLVDIIEVEFDWSD